MDNYIVSARKYRPSTFRSVVGQKSLTTTLKNAIQISACLPVLRSSWSRKDLVCPYLCEDDQLLESDGGWRGLQCVRVVPGFQ